MKQCLIEHKFEKHLYTLFPCSSEWLWRTTPSQPFLFFRTIHYFTDKMEAVNFPLDLWVPFHPFLLSTHCSTIRVSPESIIFIHYCIPRPNTTHILYAGYIATGYTAIQLCTDHPQLEQTIQVKGHESQQDCSYFRHQPHFGGPQVTHTSDQLAINPDLPWHPQNE